LYKIPANTLFVGKNLIYVPECHSTNTLAYELCQKSALAEGTVIITRDQQKGKGQRGNTWFSEPGMNLTFSLILKPTFLSPLEQFTLTMAVSLAIHDFLTQLIHGEIFIKWPNDILLNNKKVCGILIENTISGNTLQQSIVGIGFNVNQQSHLLDTATSLKLVSGIEFNLSDTLSLLLQSLEQRYLKLRTGSSDELKRDYLSVLFGVGQIRNFSDKYGKFAGVIQGVSAEGKLLINCDNEVKSFNLKEITFL
jgi:BirA family transcriptional regulator, biotin operon repressor / biotin---[acetyl-CoA-carboxylase] ligase